MRRSYFGKNHWGALRCAIVFTAAAIMTAGSSWAFKESDEGKQHPRNFDARVQATVDFQSTITPAQLSAENRLREQVSELSVRYSKATGAARTISSHTGYLSAASSAEPFDAGMAFVQHYRDLLGLSETDLANYEITDSVPSRVTGAHHIYLRQMHDGLPLYNGQLHFNINREGRVISVNNAFLSGLASSVNTRTPGLSAVDAVLRAAEDLKLSVVNAPTVLLEARGAQQETAIEAPELSQGTIIAKLMWLPIRQSEARLVWNFQLGLPSDDHWFDITVDAVSGKTWTRFDWITSVSHKVYEMPIQDPNHTTPAPPADARTVATDVHDLTASPFGWHDTDGVAGPEFTIHRGNNVHAYEDSNDSDGPPATEPDCGPTVDCDFPLDLTMAPSAYLDASVSNLFYWNNIIHDVLYLYGFDEMAGNFQVNNYGNGGAGGDDVRAEAQDGSGNCNANMFTPPDGDRARMQMFNCDIITPARNGDLDNLVIIHEYGHGITIRQVGGPANSSCLGTIQQPGEGWSDWFGLVLTATADDTGPDARGVGTWLFGEAADGPGIRDLPYSTNPSVNNWTFENIAGASVPHGVGSRWSQAIWKVYWALVDEYGFDADIYDAMGGSGNQRAMLYVNEGLKSTACGPSFLDTRDGIIQAAMDNYSGDDVCLLWESFAEFGLGVDAIANDPDSATVTNGFNIPAGCSFLGAAAPEVNACAGTDLTYDLTVGNAWTPPVNLTVGGNPAGTTVAFSLNPVPTVPNTTTLTIGNTAGAAAGSYGVTVSGADSVNNFDLPLNLNMFSGLPVASILSTPGNAATEVTVSPTLEWNTQADAVEYFVELATDAGFSNVIESSVLTGTTYTVATRLDPVAQYFWRVTATNACGTGSASSTFQFTTANVICTIVNQPIPDNPDGPLESTINVANSGTLDDLNVLVRADHTWLGDLTFTLTHDDTATSVVIIDRPGFTGSGLGCSNDNIDATLVDSATNPVEDACDPTPPAISGTFSPNNPLAGFAGEDINGSWTLSIEDAVGGDTGTLIEWCLMDTATVASPMIFSDSFEDGTTGAWSLTHP